VSEAVLALADGSTFRGQSIGATGTTSGEVVFNTALTGYQEILSDPSYSRQIVTLTYPHIGNVGTNDEDMESVAAHAAGLVIRDLPPRFSNYRSTRSLPDFLIQHGVVAIADIDTRRLTRILREKGAQNGAIVTGAARKSGDVTQLEAAALEAACAFPGLKGMDLAKVVSVPERYEWTRGSTFDAPPSRASHNPYRVVAYDFGIKHNILRMLVDAGCLVTVVPAQTRASEVLALKPEGVFLSNGPGDPEPCDYAIRAIGEIIAANVPIFGICLGHQLLGLASGARTTKMKFGHHGANHPVQDLESRRVLITSQNHGFAIDESSLPDNLVATHRSLFDGTLQGVARTDRDAFSFQGHPEASPGPHDVSHLFDRFTAAMQRRRSA
jgi:carbamoyl-phosphate synthase small subunit